MKGIFYSIIVALFLIPFLALMIFYSQTEVQNIDVNIRAEEMKYFAESIEDDLVRFLDINGKRALISAVSKVVVNGTGLDDAQLRLAEMIKNGTLYGEPAPLVDTSNLNVWKQSIDNIATKSGFNIEFEDVYTNINHSDSFHVLFDIVILMNISDLNEKMGIIRNISGIVAVSIENIEDPIFPLKTYGRVVRLIRVSNVSRKTEYLVEGLNASGYISGYAILINSSDLTTGYPNFILVTDSVAGKEGIASVFKGVVSESDVIIPPEIWGKSVTGATDAMQKIKNNTKIYLDQNTKKVWDLSNLTTDISFGYYHSGYYHNSSDGASFLDRLEGKTTLSPKYKYGLETFVNLPELTASGIVVDVGASCIDHQYWGNVTGGRVRNSNYNSVFDWFKMDKRYATIYGIDELI